MKKKTANKVAAYTTLAIAMFFWVAFIVFELHGEAYGQEFIQPKPNYSNPVHVPTDSSNKRYVIWAKNCQGCHGNGMNITDEGINTGAPTSLFTQIGPKSVEAIVEIVTNGKNKMPGFKDEMSPADLAMISRYVRVRYLLWVLQEDTQGLDVILDYSRDLLDEKKETD
jgi:hypothetical protein